MTVELLDRNTREIIVTRKSAGWSPKFYFKEASTGEFLFCAEHIGFWTTHINVYCFNGGGKRKAFSIKARHAFSVIYDVLDPNNHHLGYLVLENLFQSWRIIDTNYNTTSHLIRTKTFPSGEYQICLGKIVICTLRQKISLLAPAIYLDHVRDEVVAMNHALILALPILMLCTKGSGGGAG